MRNMKIVHKYILKDGDYHYICNQGANANWKKTDIANRRVNCKNCKKILLKCNNQKHKKVE